MNSPINKNTFSASRVQGEIKPLPGRVLVRDLEFGDRITKSGIIVPDDDGKERGVHPRWAKVWRIADDITDIKEGDWVLVDHGRWTRTFMVETEEEEVKVNMIDYPDAVLLVSDEKPE